MLGYHTPPTDKADTSLARRPPQGDPPARQTPLERQNPLRSACWEIRSTSGRYVSYWNAILVLSFAFQKETVNKSNEIVRKHGSGLRVLMNVNDIAVHGSQICVL